MFSAIPSLLKSLLTFLTAVFSIFTGSAATPGTVDLTLSSNPSTGYLWEVHIAHENVVTLQNRVHIPQQVDGMVLTGADGKEVLTFSAGEPGETLIILTCRRPWAPAEPRETLYYRATVDRDRQLLLKPAAGQPIRDDREAFTVLTAHYGTVDPDTGYPLSFRFLHRAHIGQDEGYLFRMSWLVHDGETSHVSFLTNLVVDAATGAISPFSEEELYFLGMQTLSLIQDGDFDALSRMISANGLRLSPYACVDPATDQVLTAQQLATVPTDTATYIWGSWDGSGDPISMTPAEYWARFVNDWSFAMAPEIGLNTLISTGLAVENLTEVYPESQFVDFFVPSADPINDGLDWKGLRLVFTEEDGSWKLAATIAVPAIIGNGMSQSAALFGAGVGTLVYQLFTKFRSPVFLGSSFAFISSMLAAFGGAASASAGYAGLILGAVFAGLVYVIIAIVVKFAGVNWINKLMPAVVIGPTVSIIGLSLAGNAVGDLSLGKVMKDVTNLVIKDGAIVPEVSKVSAANPYVCLICGLVTLFVVILCSVYGKKMMKLIPFIIGICAGYAVATIFTVIGLATDNITLQIIDFSVFKNLELFAIPDFTFLEAAKGLKAIDAQFIATVAVAYVPVAFVVFAEHIADHKNLSTIIGQELLEEPGLHRTLLGDGVGSMAGALFGGCPNTTYGESVGCVAITGNASIVTILATAVMAIVISFFGPFVTFLASIPNCVMGGVCITLYGFIAVSGLKMIQRVDLGENKNLFVVAVILICGIGNLSVSFGKVTLTAIACALILGILANLMVSKKSEN